MILALTIVVIFISGICIWVIGLLNASEKNAKYWRDEYFRVNDENMELFDQNMELRHPQPDTHKKPGIDLNKSW